MPIGVFILELIDRDTMEFRNVYVNNTNSKIVGADLEATIGMTLRESFPEAYNYGLPDKYMEALRTQEKVVIGEMQYEDGTIKKNTFFLEVTPLDSTHVMLTTENISRVKP